MSECDSCVAADLTGVEMNGHDSFIDREPAPPGLGEFTAALSASRSESARNGIYRGAPLTGKQVAHALQRIIDGENPKQVGRETGELLYN